MKLACAAGRFLPEIVQIRPLLRALPSARRARAGRGSVGVHTFASLKRPRKCPFFSLPGSTSCIAEWPDRVGMSP